MLIRKFLLTKNSQIILSFLVKLVKNIKNVNTQKIKVSSKTLNFWAFHQKCKRYKKCDTSLGVVGVAGSNPVVPTI